MLTGRNTPTAWLDADLTTNACSHMPGTMVQSRNGGAQPVSALSTVLQNISDSTVRFRNTSNLPRVFNASTGGRGGEASITATSSGRVASSSRAIMYSISWSRAVVMLPSSLVASTVTSCGMGHEGALAFGSTAGTQGPSCSVVWLVLVAVATRIRTDSAAFIPATYYTRAVLVVSSQQ